MNMQIEPTVSVVIPTFNRSHMVTDAIRSAAEQEFPPLEIIVVDDGSTDDTADVVSRLVTHIPVHYHSRPHRGPAATNNFGVSVASGAWIAFLDSDDLWYPQKLKVQMDCVKAYADVPFFYSDMDYVVLDENSRECPTQREWDSILIPLVFRGLPNAHVPTVLLRRDVFVKEGGFNPALQHGESWELFARIAAKHRLHYIPQSLAKQRLHPGQLTRDLRTKARVYHHFHSAMLEVWKQDKAKRTILVKETARVYADLGKHFLQIGDYAYARKCLGRSLSYRCCSLRNWRRLIVSCMPAVRSRCAARERPS